VKSAARLVLTLAVAGCVVFGTRAMTQPGGLVVLDPSVSAGQARQDMLAAQREGAAARVRAEKLEHRARAVSRQADATAREAAAVAARIQEADAQIAVQDAQLRLITSQRAVLRRQLAKKQEPLARLTASLQRLSRRPPLLAVLRPGSVRDAVYMRALLDTMLPEVERRTRSLRASIEQGRALEQQAKAAAAGLVRAQSVLRERRQQLAAIETRQRLDGRKVSGIAARESERALALAEKARDLGDLVTEVGKQGRLRAQLAALPGPILRPARPEEARVIGSGHFDALPEGLSSYVLPVTGRVLTGFGEDAPGEARSRGLVLVPRAHAQVIAPAAGRIAFAGPYRGYGSIVIVEHASGWTSLVTGLARAAVEVGESVVAGSPIGTAGPLSPRVMVELRHDGMPVNPLQYVRSL
jgi:septal ring factor EnvC (AmiA/AmiB activator)